MTSKFDYIMFLKWEIDLHKLLRIAFGSYVITKYEMINEHIKMACNIINKKNQLELIYKYVQIYSIIQLFMQDIWKDWILSI